jgi:hypothetical protein
MTPSSLAYWLGVLVLVTGLCVVSSGCGKITKTNADRITNGMSEKEVADILGPPTKSADLKMPSEIPWPVGDDMPEVLKGAKKYVIKDAKECVWKDGNKVITVTFLDGKVMRKVTAGF